MDRCHINQHSPRTTPARFIPQLQPARLFTRLWAKKNPAGLAKRGQVGRYLLGLLVGFLTFHRKIKTGDSAGIVGCMGIMIKTH